MPTLLTDFTFEQLLFASMMYKASLTECNDKIELILKFQDGLVKTELLFHWMTQRDYASIWLTQIDTALIEVKRKDIIQSN